MDLKELIEERNRLYDEINKVEKQILDKRCEHLSEKAKCYLGDFVEYFHPFRPQDNFSGQIVGYASELAFKVAVRKKDGTIGNQTRNLYLSQFENVKNNGKN